MAIGEDVSRTGLNNQKRGVCVAVVEGLTEAQILLTGVSPFKLPDNVLILKVLVNVTTVSGTASATVDVCIGATPTVIVNEIPVTVAGEAINPAVIVAAAVKQATGGVITIKAGATTPADGALVCDLMIEYVEIDKVSGEYTPYAA